MSLLQTLSFKGPITSCEFFNENILLIGSGPYLSLVNADTFEIIHQSKCLEYRIICGILIHKSLICVYGEKAFNICELNADLNGIRILNERFQQLDDLIWTIDWLNSDKLMIVCAHNQFIVYNLKEKFIEKCVFCSQKCMIYSAKILNFNDFDTIMIASGTIFNRILIWNSTNGSIACTLDGHQGVIFSIGFDTKTNYLYSVSDDRSVIVWKLDSINDEKSIDGKLCSKFFGHEARVWKCVWFETDKGEAFLCSIGEDLKCCIWSLNENKLFYRFNTIRKGSKNIWSVCINKNNYSLITGWQDGGLRKYELKWYLGLGLDDLAINKNLNELMIKYEFEKDYARTIELNDNLIICCTNNGFVYSICGREDQKCILKDENLKSYNCMAKIEKYLAIGSGNGKIFFIENSELRKCFDCCEIELSYDSLLKDEKPTKFKIFSLLWQNQVDSKDLYLLASFTFLNGLLHVYRFNSDTFELELKSRLTLPDSKHRWPTSFLITNNYIFTGDKCGNLSLYKNNQELGLKSPLQTISHISKQNSSINGLYFKQSNQLICCSNDGFYYLFKIDDNSLEMINKYEINSSIDLLQALIFDESKSFDIEQNLLLALCFYGDKFLLWSFNLNRSIVEIRCGGANRSWSYEFRKLNDSNYLFKLIFLKQKSIVEFSKTFHVNELGSCMTKVNHLQQVFHGNNISSCLYFNKTYLITGSEDTQVIVNKCDQQLSHNYHLQGHDSVIKCMSLRVLDKYSSLLVTAGGKANMKLWKIKINDEEIIEQIILICEFKRFTKNKRQSIDLESNPDIRFMDCDIYSLDNFEFFIYFACSDGLIRIFKYTLNSKKIILTDNCQYDRCLLCLKYLDLKAGSFIICSSTDGHLIFYKLENHLFSTDKSPWKIIKSVHQSGINSFDIWTKNENEILLATIGDDSTLNILNLSSIELNSQNLIKKEMAHSSSIMGGYSK